MRFLETFQAYDFGDTFVSLLTAFVLSTLIGAERQYHQRTTGLRTHVLVAVAAAAFVDLGIQVDGGKGGARVISYVVTGIGFLGAGAIMKEGVNVRGLNTAATLWASAAVGACAGADMIAQSVLLTGFVLMTNVLLRPLFNAINRLPVDERRSEATYEVRLTTTAATAAKVRELLSDKLEEAKYPIRDIKVIDRPEGTIEIVAVLINSSVQAEELDGVVAALASHPGTQHATWGAMHEA